jgi:phytoene/squalene synthetase
MRTRPRARAVAVNPDSQSARYFALLYAAHAERPALEALFGIEREVLDSARPGLDHNVAHSRLQWWREECERAARGGAAHPLTRALTTALGDPQAKSVPQLAGLCGIVDVATWDLASATFETRRELDAYCQRWAVAMIEPLVAVSTRPAVAAASPTPTARSPATSAISTRGESSGASPDSTGSAKSAASASTDPGASAALLASAERTAAWQDLGAAICEIELLAGLALDAHQGRIRLPLDELGSANVDTNSLAETPWPETVAALMRGRLTFLRNEIERSVAGSSREQQRALRGLLVWAALSWRTAQRMERALPNRPQPGRFDGFSDAWFAWRIARQATVGRFRLN